MSNITSEVITITPDIALDMLKQNTRNRPMNKEQVLYYANQMQRGQWQLNGESIIFSDGNVLLDGQHRLAAIVKSQTSQKMLVVRGVDGNTFATIDTGKLRTASNVFALEGIKNYTNVGSGIKSYLLLTSNYNSDKISNTKSKITNADLLSEYNCRPDFYARCLLNAQSCYRKVRLMKISMIFAYGAYLVLQKMHTEDKVWSFFRQLFGIDPIQNTSITFVRDRLLQNLSGQYRLTERFQRALIIKAWNDYVKGVEHKILRWNPETDEMPTFI